MTVPRTGKFSLYHWLRGRRHKEEDPKIQQHKQPAVRTVVYLSKRR